MLRHGVPERVRLDNGAETTAQHVKHWLETGYETLRRPAVILLSFARFEREIIPPSPGFSVIS